MLSVLKITKVIKVAAVVPRNYFASKMLPVVPKIFEAHQC